MPLPVPEYHDPRSGWFRGGLGRSLGARLLLLLIRQSLRAPLSKRLITTAAGRLGWNKPSPLRRGEPHVIPTKLRLWRGLLEDVCCGMGRSLWAGGGWIEAGDEWVVGWCGPSRFTFNFTPAESSSKAPWSLAFFHSSTVPRFHSSTCILSSDSRWQSSKVRSRNQLPQDIGQLDICGWLWRSLLAV